jgi:hypothetical protein
VNIFFNGLEQAISGHLSLSYAYFAPDEFVMQENITVSTWREKYSNSCTAENKTISDYGGYAYDAVWTYGLGIYFSFTYLQSNKRVLSSLSMPTYYYSFFYLKLFSYH